MRSRAIQRLGAAIESLGCRIRRAACGGRCYDCGRRYGERFGFPDLIVPDRVWTLISPTGDGGGLLCPSCICRRAWELGVQGVPAAFESGPFADHDAAAHREGARAAS